MNSNPLLEPQSLPIVYEWCTRAARSPVPGAIVDGAIIVAVVGYVVAAARMKRPIHRGQALAFAAGVTSIVLALSGPLERLSLDRLYVAYVLQQLVLMLVAPPLLLLGLPDWMLRPVLTHPKVVPVARRLTNPITTFCLFSGVFAAIHFPNVCNHVCHVHTFYYSLRALLLIAGLLVWWPLLSPLPEYPRLSYPAQLLYLFLLIIPMTTVSAPVTLADTVLYDFYEIGPHPFGLTPLADQSLGGLLMWVGSGIYLICVATIIFSRWASHEDQDNPVVFSSKGVAASHSRATIVPLDQLRGRRAR